jgi:hypothetical protein
MTTHIFLLCYNEEILLPHTIQHYRKNIPDCKITIYDNESTDSSVEIAKKLGCEIITWTSNNKTNDYKFQEIKNTCWKKVENSWIIVADMDEWLCVTASDLKEEREKGTTILKIRGYNVIGQSQKEKLEDVDLHNLNQVSRNEYEDKNICFYANDIKDINFSIGAHHCSPSGNVKFSNTCYIIKHMEYLGLPFIIDKIKKRYERSSEMRKQNIATHYTDDVEKIKRNYDSNVQNSTALFYVKLADYITTEVVKALLLIVLFILLTPTIIFRLPMKGKLVISVFVHSVLFAFIVGYLFDNFY